VIECPIAGMEAPCKALVSVCVSQITVMCYSPVLPWVIAGDAPDAPYRSSKVCVEFNNATKLLRLRWTFKPIWALILGSS